MFEKFNFSKEQVERFFTAAERDLKIAREAKAPEAVFLFAYNALIKTAIAVCARKGLRVRSQQGHHRELIEKLATHLGDEDVEVIGNEMREKRNWDFYDGGVTLSEKETGEYLEWVNKVFKKSR